MCPARCSLTWETQVRRAPGTRPASACGRPCGARTRPWPGGEHRAPPCARHWGDRWRESCRWELTVWSWGDPPPIKHSSDVGWQVWEGGRAGEPSALGRLGTAAARQWPALVHPIVPKQLPRLPSPRRVGGHTGGEAEGTTGALGRGADRRACAPHCTRTSGRAGRVPRLRSTTLRPSGDAGWRVPVTTGWRGVSADFIYGKGKGSKPGPPGAQEIRFGGRVLR